MFFGTVNTLERASLWVERAGTHQSSQILPNDEREQGMMPHDYQITASFDAADESHVI